MPCIILYEVAQMAEIALEIAEKLRYNAFEIIRMATASTGGIRMDGRTYVAIDLKSFYASVECVERGLDPLKTNLVVADPKRTEKTICLAVSPSLKAYGIPGRARLFEVVEKTREVNARRRMNAPRRTLTGKSFDADELKTSPELELDYIVAPPRMAKYMEVSAAVYRVYLRHIAPEDICVYSVDEVFIDVTGYLATYRMTARELTVKLIGEVLEETGITATAGIGTNLYLSKIAMDIVAKHIGPDANGARIAELNERSYRELLWGHRPITDFWRVGRGTAKRLADNGLFTMGDIARCSLGRAGDYHNEALLYRLFGVNAELLIDHAWGYEPCTMADIRAYRPATSSISSGQVLQCPYPFDKARLVAREMTDLLVLDLVEKRLVTDQMVLTVGYDIENAGYRGETETDRYGRRVPKQAHGSVNLGGHTSSTQAIMQAVGGLFDRIVNPNLLVRRMYVVANHVLREADAPTAPKQRQLDFFTDYAAEEAQRAHEQAARDRERRIQEALIGIKHKYGKNAILKGMNFEDGATARQRNAQIGGHRA